LRTPDNQLRIMPAVHSVRTQASQPLVLLVGIQLLLKACRSQKEVTTHGEIAEDKLRVVAFAEAAT
jgi:hypothetical protein